MSAAIPFPTLLITLQKLYYRYCEKHNLRAVENSYTLFNRLKNLGSKMFTDGQLVNGGEADLDQEDGQSDVLDPEVFLFKVLEVLEEYFKPIEASKNFEQYTKDAALS
jgi:hypothetical protein